MTDLPEVRSGLLVLDKSEGVTSFAALNDVKKALSTKKIGHCGTLDRFASGVLVVVCGRYTRLASRFESLDKRYVAEFRFGAETDTLDPEGEVVGEGPVPSREEVLAALPAFRGTIAQVPPAYSAVHVDGQRAYKRALAGEEVKLEARAVTIHSLDLVEASGDRFVFDVRCSKGTYIRSLARDLALALGTRAYVTGLRRASIGPFDESMAAKAPFGPDSLLTIDAELARSVAWIPVTLGGADAERFVNGIMPKDSGFPISAQVAAFGPDGDLLGIVSNEGGKPRFEAVIA